MGPEHEKGDIAGVAAQAGIPIPIKLC